MFDIFWFKELYNYDSLWTLIDIEYDVLSACDFPKLNEVTEWNTSSCWEHSRCNKFQRRERNQIISLIAFLFCLTDWRRREVINHDLTLRNEFYWVSERVPRQLYVEFWLSIHLLIIIFFWMLDVLNRISKEQEQYHNHFQMDGVRRNMLKVEDKLWILSGMRRHWSIIIDHHDYHKN